MTHISKPTKVKAVQWLNHGNHKAVQHLEFDPFDKCPKCGFNTRVHGWLNLFGGGVIVCPGDWIVQDEFGFTWAIRNDIFNFHYEAI